MGPLGYCCIAESIIDCETKAIYNGNWMISRAPCQNGFNLEQTLHGKSQLYEIRIGEYPGQVSNYFDQWAQGDVTEYCYYDQSTRAIVRDIKDRITNLGPTWTVQDLCYPIFVYCWLGRQELRN